jgi:large subunit ribosomal protein L17
MHRHGYQGKKFGRERDQRQALLKGLADSLVLNAAIETTLPKAKEVANYTEKVVTKAKKGDLHNRRQVIKSLATLEAAHKLVDDIAPKLSTRNSGYFRVIRTRTRRGDGAQLAKVSFVDDLTIEVKPAKKPEAAKPKAAAKKPVTAKKSAPTRKPATKAKVGSKK